MKHPTIIRSAAACAAAVVLAACASSSSSSSSGGGSTSAGPITPLTFLVSIWFVAVTPSATSQLVSPVVSWSLRPRTPPAELISLTATWEPWSIAWPRLASRPVKQERTP